LEQLQQLLKLLPQNHKTGGTEIDEELGNSFAGILCTHARVDKSKWILDLGATYHMAFNLDLLCEPKVLQENSTITLPDGNTFTISSVGKV